MLMELDVKYINPHQDTSVLGQIMPNYLALNPTVNYRKFFDNNCTLSMEGFSLDRFGKTVNVSHFYDNGGEYFHQSNDKVRKFY